MLNGTADDLIPMLGGKQMLKKQNLGKRENEDRRLILQYTEEKHKGKECTRVRAHTHFVATHQSAEASVQDAEAALIIRDLHETLHVPIVVGTHHPVGVRVDLVDAAWCHLKTYRPPGVAPVVLVAVVTLLYTREDISVKKKILGT